MVKNQATRSKSQNYNNARRILAEKVELLQRGDESRAVKKAERAAKKKASAVKKKRRKYKELADADTGGTEPEEEGAQRINERSSQIHDYTASGERRE